MSPKRKQQIARKARPSAPLKAGTNSQLGTFRVRNRALLVTVIANTTNTVYPFASYTLSLSTAGMAKGNLGWLANLMTLYDEFKVESIELEWVPAASSFTSGSLAMYYDPTPAAKAPQSFAAVSGNAGVVTTQISKSVRHKISSTILRGRLPWYLTDSSDISTTTQGTIVVCQSPGSVPSATGKVMLGSVWMTYQISLRNPTYLSVSSYAVQIQPAPLLEQNVYEELQQLNAQLARQVEAQEDTAESCQIIANKPSLPTNVGGDVSSASTNLAALLSSVQHILNAVDTLALNIPPTLGSDLQALKQSLSAMRSSMDSTASDIHSLKQPIIDGEGEFGPIIYEDQGRTYFSVTDPNA